MMKQATIALVFSWLLLVGCTVEQPALTAAPVAHLPTTTPTPLDTATSAPTPTEPVLATTLPTDTPSPTIPAATPEPTQRPTSTPVALDPSLPLPTGRIYFLWDPNPIPEERGIGELPETSLFEAIPGAAPNDWYIERVVEMFGKPIMIPAPDFTKLAILRYDDTNGDGVVDTQRGTDVANVYSYNVVNSSLTHLTENQWSPGTVSWLSNAQALTYPQLNDLYVVELNAPLHTSKLISYSGNIYNHAWSPNGNFLASLHAPSAQPTSIIILDIFNPENNSVSNISEITSVPKKLLWSQNSQWLAFSQYIGRGLQIVNVRAGEVKELVPFDNQVFSEWAPNDSSLAFTYDSKLFLWDANTEISTELFSAEVLGAPSWSSSGNDIAVGYADREQSGILIIDPVHYSQERMDLGMTVSQVFWSPDGQWLLFSSELDDRVGLYMVNRKGGIPFIFLETTGREFPYAIFWLPVQ